MNRVKINSKLAMLAAMFATAFTFNACTYNDYGDTTVPAVSSSSKYAEAGSSSSGEAVPSIDKYLAIPSQDTGNDKIKYSYSYGGYDFYYIHLGRLENVPVYYEDAVFLGTFVEEKYEFSTLTAETSYMRNIVTNSSQKTKIVADEHTYSTTNKQRASGEINAKFPIPIKLINIGIKASGEASWEQYIKDYETTIIQEAASLTSTEETALSYTTERRETFTWNFSKVKGDREGWYRRTLFTVSDVYLYVIKDSTEVIHYEFKEHIKQPSVFGWRLDYSETLSFEKSDATGFEFDVSMLDNLPKPAVIFTPPLPAVPNNVSVFAQSSTSIIVSWDIVSNADSYEIHRSASENGTYSFVGTSTTVSYTDTGLSESATYYYKILAVNSNGSSAFSSSTSAKTKSAVIREHIEEFVNADSHTYTFDKGFPATVEIYALGAGGGGQGGFEWDLPGGAEPNKIGTGGGGGGGAAAYMGFDITEPIDFSINVGKGGDGGRFEWFDAKENCGGFLQPKCNNYSNWIAGYAGSDGKSTTVAFTVGFVKKTLTAGGGSRAPRSKTQDISGGDGGTANFPSATCLQNVLTSSPNGDGNKGLNGQSNLNQSLKNNGQQMDYVGGGGSAGSLNIGTYGNFPGILGGGYGGNGGAAGINGNRGGDGKVVIVITYFE